MVLLLFETMESPVFNWGITSLDTLSTHASPLVRGGMTGEGFVVAGLTGWVTGKLKTVGNDGWVWLRAIAGSLQGFSSRIGSTILRGVTLLKFCMNNFT